MVELKEKITREHLESRIDDWVRRLEGLYDQVDEWRTELLPNSESKRPQVIQRNEPLMRDFGVEPRKIPSYVLSSGAIELSFIPYVLWVLGANGWVDIIARPWDRCYIVCDLDGMADSGSYWYIPLKDSEKFHAPFTKEHFRKIIENTL